MKLKIIGQTNCIFDKYYLKLKLSLFYGGWSQELQAIM